MINITYVLFFCSCALGYHFSLNTKASIFPRGVLYLVPEDSSSQEIKNNENIDSIPKSKGFSRIKPIEKSDPDDIDLKIKETKMYKSIRTKQESQLNEKIAKLKEEEDLLATDPSVGEFYSLNILVSQS